MNTVADKKTGNLLHGVFTDANSSQMADNMGPARQHPASDRNAMKRSTERTKKRRKREAANTQDESSFSVPPAKKARTENLSSQYAAFENPPPAQNIADTYISSPPDDADVERHISPSLMKSIVATYEVTSMNIISSSRIQSKVTTIIEKLGSFSFVTATPPNLVLLRAKDAVASKLITIVEITKREIAKAGGKWYQYNVLGQVLAPQEKKSAAMKGTGFMLGRKTNSDIDAMELHGSKDGQNIEEEEETSFETMKTPLERAIEGKPKVQAIPVILIFLTRVRSDALKEAYG